ncbi:MAG: hypothetical protein LUF92_02340 [Clostridiales bacterium]|nr:hypothetical protein [Clostridiales bacterium]
MKLHRVLLFTTMQMDITPVGDDLHVLLIGGDKPGIGCTSFSTPVPDTDPVRCNTTCIRSADNADSLFCTYVAEELAKRTGKRTLCTGGIFVDNPSEHELEKLYENVDDMIHDWMIFYD